VVATQQTCLPGQNEASLCFHRFQTHPQHLGVCVQAAIAFRLETEQNLKAVVRSISGREFVAQFVWGALETVTWEKRGASRYFYSAQRVGDRIEKVYHGRGVAAQEAAQMAEKKKVARDRDMHALQQFETGLWELDQRMRLVRQQSGLALQAAYFLAGYEQTACYHWRKTTSTTKENGMNKDVQKQIDARKKNGHEPRQDKSLTPALPKTIAETVAEIKGGRTELLPHLQRQLANDPVQVAHWAAVTNHTIRSWAGQIAGDDILTRESIALAAQQDRQQLLDAASSPLEKLAVFFVVVAKLQANYYDLAASFFSSQKSVETKLAEAVTKRQRSAHFQFREASTHVEKIRFLEGVTTPVRPAIASSQALRVFNPDKSSTLSRKLA
jgi:hypothetical protein